MKLELAFFLVLMINSALIGVCQGLYRRMKTLERNQCYHGRAYGKIEDQE